MGEGARIVFVNWTKYRLRRTHISSKNMAEWEHNPDKNVPMEIPAFSFNRFYIEYSDHIFKKHIECKAEAIFEFEELGLHVILTMHSKPKRHVEVNWK